MAKKKRFSMSCGFVPFIGLGLGYQKRMRSCDIIILLPFVDIQLTYNYIKKN